MKNSWTKPTLTTYGAVEELTKVKEFGKNDGISFDSPVAIPGVPGTPGIVSIGS